MSIPPVNNAINPLSKTSPPKQVALRKAVTTLKRQHSLPSNFDTTETTTTSTPTKRWSSVISSDSQVEKLKIPSNPSEAPKKWSLTSPRGENDVILRSFLERKASKSENITSFEKATNPFVAIQQGNLAQVQALIKNQADLTITSIEQETLLHVAAFYGHREILVDLLKHPHSKNMIHAKDSDGKTPLHKAVWEMSKPDIVALLIQNGANVNVQNDYGYTPLHWAAKHGHTESAELCSKTAPS